MELSEQKELLSPDAFYNNAVESFQQLAVEQGFAKKGPMLVEELSELGDKTAFQFLTDKFVIKQFGSNPIQFYYSICNTCFMAGVVFADNWFHNGKKLNRDFADDVIVASPHRFAVPILKEKLGFDDETLKTFLGTVFNSWLELHDPYWDHPDHKTYTIKLMAAAYQLGLSLVLEKYGC